MEGVKQRKLSQTTSLCPTCKNGVPSEIWERDHKIYLEKKCSDHGESRVLISSDALWYHRTMGYSARISAPSRFEKPVQRGCPFDCGTCPSHRQKNYLPVIALTSACNLQCPICYTINKNKNAFFMSMDELDQILEVIKESDPDLQIINFTGGEPTIHPQLVEMIQRCHQAGIHRITLSTNGLVFLKKEKLLADLAELQTRVVLSFNSFNDETNKKMLGRSLTKEKLQILELLEKHNVDTTLIPVIAQGLNDSEMDGLVDLLLSKKFLRSLEIHTMTFTGQGGGKFDLENRITLPDVLGQIEKSSGGKIASDDFLPSPCAHPLCYQTSYLLEISDGEFLPFSRFMSTESIRELLTDNLYMEPGEKMETILQDVIMELWAREIPEEMSSKILKTLKNLIHRLFPEGGIPYDEQQIIAERSAKTIYIHSHMDEHTFDVDRIRECCVGVPYPDGRWIPTCAYNILYREQEPRFTTGSAKDMDSYTGGKIIEKMPVK